MLTLMIAAAMLPQGDAAALVGKMLARYDGAKTLTGTIRFTQTANNVSIVIDTAIQYEKPSKLFIRQERRSSEPRIFLVTSDGQHFSYDLPEDRVAAQGERLIEPVKQLGRDLDIRQIYAAASRSLGDRSAPLDIAIARTEDLRFIRNQWATVDFAPSQPDTGLRVVTGNWRLNATAPASGQYEMWITEEGELKRYQQSEIIQPETTVLDEKFRPRPLGLNAGPIQIVSIWDVNLQVDGKPDNALFKVVR